MKKITSILLCIAACQLFGGAQNATGSTQENIVASLLKNGESGASSYTLDENKELKTLFIVGVAPLNKALPIAYAKKVAAKQARLDAENTLSKTLNTMFEAKITESGEIVTTIKGEAAGDNQGSGSTQSSLTSQISEEMRSVTKSAQAGLMQLNVDPNRDGSYVAVYFWNANLTKQLKKVSKISAETAQQSLKDYKETKDIADEGNKTPENAAAKSNPAPQQKQPQTGTFGKVKGNPNQKIVLPEGL